MDGGRDGRASAFRLGAVIAHMVGASVASVSGERAALCWPRPAPPLSFGVGCDGRKVVAARPTCFWVHSTRGGLWLFWRSQARGWLLFFLSDLLATLCSQLFSGSCFPLHTFQCAVGQVLVLGGLLGVVGRSQILRFLLYWKSCPVDNLWITCGILWIT